MSEQNHFGISATAWMKFDLGLQRASNSIHADQRVELPVMIALATPAGPSATTREGPLGPEERARMAAEQQAAFEREAADLVQELTQLGARDLRLFWINRTVSGRLTLPALEAAGRRQEVKQIVLAVRQNALLHGMVV
jgi:hypothetical protein